MKENALFTRHISFLFHDINLVLEDFKAKVMSDYHHSRKVSVKQKSRNSRYRLDNRNRNDHDDRDDDDGQGRRAGAKDLSKRIGNRFVSTFDFENYGIFQRQGKEKTLDR